MIGAIIGTCLLWLMYVSGNGLGFGMSVLFTPVAAVIGAAVQYAGAIGR